MTDDIRCFKRNSEKYRYKKILRTLSVVSLSVLFFNIVSRIEMSITKFFTKI
nr:MAG TPA: hypothetical protein [Caudoviricetes sp.]